ncbi:hypothetical protein V6N12_054473 [Hibiscus sabdariffa]|uniref:Uncharacterized protein n=1 Tax=Hibiscus sabdariffa TaxID=183260 RepID=A0ABR2D0I8_9ROSI
MQRSKTSTGSVPVEMANPPVEIGTRGTVGSLIMREIDFSNSEEEKERKQQANTEHVFHGGDFRQQAGWGFRFRLSEPEIRC